MLNVEYASALSILDCLFRFPSRLFTNITDNNASSISARFKSYFREIGQLRMTDMATGCDVTEGHVTG